jgi:PilZ domain
VRRLRETQRVGLGIGQYSVDCVVVALESDEAVLLPLRERSEERLPGFSANGTLVFRDATRALVMLRGVIRYDPEDDLAFFSVGDGVGKRSMRRASRAPLMRPVTLTPAGGAPLTGMTTDLSCGGLGARVEDPGPAGTELAIALDLGDGEPPLACDGVVVARRDATVAVRFGELTPDQERRLQRRVLGALRRRAQNAA